MKKSVIILMLFVLGNTIAQSVSASKVLNILESQNLSLIKTQLVKLGFKSMSKEIDYNIQIESYMKSDRLGKEHIEVGKNSELFMFVYKPANRDIYNSIKSKFLTSNFKNSYSYKENKYYETDNMRIGINDKFSIISFFVALKK